MTTYHHSHPHAHWLTRRLLVGLVALGMGIAAAGRAPQAAHAAIVPRPTQIVPEAAELPRLLPNIATFTAHVVQEGETLASIAAATGSMPHLIRGYNRLKGEPAVGRALIIPVLEGHSTEVYTPVLVINGVTDAPKVALTLDAGASSAPTPAILDALRERNIQITFFLTGQWIRNNPELARRIVTEGHELANHSTNHPDFRTLSDEQIIAELADMEQALFEATGASARPYFRPPFGAYDQRVLQVLIGQGYMPIYWTLDSLDSVGEPKSPQFLADRMTGHGQYTPEQMYGTIILAHCGSEPTAQALPTILDRYAAMGIKVTTISDVLGQ